MIKSRPSIEERDLLEIEIRELLKHLGQGKVNGVAYDTAWVARLSPQYPGCGFEESLEWLRRHQYEDGSWGGLLIHYHDRFISTLASIVTLQEVGRDSRDERRVKRGEDALWKLVGKLGRDDSDTVGFPILAASLVAEASQVGLDVPRPPVRFAKAYSRKVDALLNQAERDWLGSTLTFSIEALRDAISEQDCVLEKNHSVHASLSATAGYLLAQPHSLAVDYLQKSILAEGTGAAPALAPIDIFEIAWSLIHMMQANAVSVNHPEVRRALDFLWGVWSPEVGVPTSTCFSVPDLDDTAACFAVLQWGGYPVDASVFAYYEREEHFCCYPNETNPSLSGHIRLLNALRLVPDYPNYDQWVNKIVRFLHIFDENGSFWWDKWQCSPYYVNSTALSALNGLDNDLARSRLKWIIRTQGDDGGWGYLGESTSEETAYCLEALLLWDRKVEPIEPSVLDAAGQYLMSQINRKDLAPLWIGKSLYTPYYPVKSVILGALFSYLNRGG